MKTSPKVSNSQQKRQSTTLEIGEVLCFFWLFLLGGIAVAWLIMCLEIVGTVSFALSGAMTGLKKKMDLLGVCALGITTAIGGGVLRDLILGITPPTAFIEPVYILIALCVSVVIFIPFARKVLSINKRVYEIILLLADSAGLGIFTVCGMKVAMIAGYEDNAFLVIFVGVVTGVGGGVIRDVLAGDRPYIFVKHIYACAAVVGAVVCRIMWDISGQDISMLIGFAIIIAIRLCSARFRLNLPKANDVDIDEEHRE